MSENNDEIESNDWDTPEPQVSETSTPIDKEKELIKDVIREEKQKRNGTGVIK